MPFIKVQTNQKVKKEEELLKKLSAEMAEQLGKPESYIMTALEAELKMTFGGSKEKTAFIEVKSIGLKQSMTEELSQFICEFIEQELEIEQDRIYIEFANVPGAMWGWDGGTFQLEAEAKVWLKAKSGLSNIVIKELISEETRPRVLKDEDGILLNLRGLNLNSKSDEEDMVSLHMWIEPGKIITTRSERVFTIDDIDQSYQKGDGPMYILSIVSSIFLLLSFLTGLFGINIGGMPGTESNAAFGIFSILMLVIIGVEYWLFKRNDWI